MIGYARLKRKNMNHWKYWRWGPQHTKNTIKRQTCVSVGFAVSAFSSTFTINTLCIFSEIAESKCPSNGEI